MTNQVLKNEDFLEKQLIVMWGKITANARRAERWDIVLMNARIGRITNLLKPCVA